MKTQRLVHRRTAACIGATALLTTGLLILLLPSHPGGEAGEKPTRNRVANSQDLPLTSLSGDGPKGSPSESLVTEVPPAVAATLTAFEAEFKALAAETGLTKEERATKARAILSRLREALRGLPADQAAAAIVAFLNTRRDVSTGLGFTLAAGGVLEDAPTLRTSLLDLLGQFDPNLSVEYARTVFADRQNAEEWALALRSLGWQNQDGVHTAELRTRLTEMLDNSAWLAQPGSGFFESFDLAVHLGGTAEFSAMASVMRLTDSDGNPVRNGTTHAAYLALDRLTTMNPDQTLTQIAADTDLLSWAPEHRGSLIARADVTSPAQLTALESCLATIATRPQELETFTTMFPNRNGTLGNALVTTPPAQTPHEVLIAGDKAALATVNRRIQGGTYPVIEENLRTIAARLQGFVASAGSQ